MVESNHPAARLREAHLHDHFGTLLVLLVATFVISGLGEYQVAKVTTSLLEMLMVFVAFSSTRASDRFPTTMAVLLVTTGALVVVSAVVDLEQSTVRGIAALLVAAVYLALLVAVSRRVAAAGQVTLEMIFGGLCVYFLIGLMFAAIYTAIDSFSAAAMFGEPVEVSSYSYFSFVTLTTVGYGDLAAVSELGRRFAVVEAITGQIFLATVVARLVSLYGRQVGPRES